MSPKDQVISSCLPSCPFVIKKDSFFYCVSTHIVESTSGLALGKIVWSVGFLVDLPDKGPEYEEA